MSKFKIGQKVRVTTKVEPGPSVGFTSVVSDYSPLTKYYSLKGAVYGEHNADVLYLESELEAVDEVESDTKIEAFRKATELLPDGLVEDRIQLAEWLIKDG